MKTIKNINLRTPEAIAVITFKVQLADAAAGSRRSLPTPQHCAHTPHTTAITFTVQLAGAAAGSRRSWPTPQHCTHTPHATAITFTVQLAGAAACSRRSWPNSTPNNNILKYQTMKTYISPNQNPSQKRTLPIITIHTSKMCALIILYLFAISSPESKLFEHYNSLPKKRTVLI